MARELQSGQRSELFVIDVETAAASLRFSSDTLLFEAPNWSPDGESLIINGDGRLFRLPVDGGADGGDASAGLDEIDLGGIAEINNDHRISPDGGTAYVSSEDGHIYAVELSGSGSTLAGMPPRRVTNDNGPNFRHYLHGVSPDGATLAYIGMAIDGVQVTTNVYTLPSNGGPDVQLTNDNFPDDGAEFSPDGQWIYFNSERGSTSLGHAQLFRMPASSNTNNSSPSDGGPEQLTFDERVNWFPHPSPDGSQIAYVSFPPGTVGHPADVPVVVRLLEQDGSIRDLAQVFGGQGTMTFPTGSPTSCLGGAPRRRGPTSWSPDGTRIAIAAYPVN